MKKSESGFLKNTEPEKSYIEKISRTLPHDEFLYDLGDLFKIFGDSTRIKILMVLRETELKVQDIAEIKMTQSAISHQLKVLKQSKLVKFRKDGKTVLYSLADSHVLTIISQGIEHLSE